MPNRIAPLTSSFCVGLIVPIPTLPELSILNLSLPAVSTVNVSALGNLIAVFVSPVWKIESAIDTPEPTTRNLSTPSVSTVNVSALGNLIAVFVSPV